MRYVFPARLIMRGDERLARRYIGEARAFMGALMQYIGEGKLRRGKRRKLIGDVVIDVQFDGTLATMVITAPPVPRVEPFASKGAIWIPRGFVVYPASDDSPTGWGLPVVQIVEGGEGSGAGVYTEYSDVNIAPGLNTARWTPDGARGQVLITDIVRAGYPDDDKIAVPIAYSRQFGPRLPDDYVHTRPAHAVHESQIDTFAAYRLELTGFNHSQSITPDAQEHARIRAFKRGIFERVNEHRLSIGRTRLEMPIRGFYDSAQVTAEIDYSASVLGHYAAQFPLTYRTPEDRMTRDGLHDFYVVYTDPDSRNANIGENLAANVASPPTEIGVDPDGVPIYLITANGIEQTAQSAFDGWMASPPHKANIENANYDRYGFSATCTNIGMRYNYAAQHFQRNDQWISCGNRQFECPDNLAPISWFGFPTMNLSWETWPALITTSMSDPLFLLVPAFATNDDTSTWMAYYSAPGAQYQVPALSRVVYSAGRAIAYAPGLVWAAGVHKLESGLYRLVVLTHNEADQPSDKYTNGMTPILRIYYCDMAAIPNGALSPESMIRGIYGTEDEGWPWDRVNNPCSWRGGATVDVSSYTGGEVPNLLKYRSQWVFNADATKAVCMRDQGTYVGGDPFSGGYSVYPYNTTVGTFTDGLFAATVIMDIEHTDLGVTPTLSFLERYVGSGFLPSPPAPPAYDEFFMEHIAVDFDDNGELIFATRGGGFLIGSFATAGPNSTLAMTSAYYAMGVGPYGVDPATQPGFIYLTPDELGNITGMWSRIHVLSIRDRVFVVERAPVDSPCFIDTAGPALRVEMFIDGVGQGQVIVSNPTTIWLGLRCCYQIVAEGSAYARMSYLSVAELVQSYYVRHEGDFIAGFNVLPQRNLAFKLIDWPTPYGDCLFGDCIPTSRDRSLNVSVVDFSDMLHLGSFVTSSLDGAEGLQTLVATEGDGFRLLHARVV